MDLRVISILNDHQTLTWIYNMTAVDIWCTKYCSKDVNYSETPIFILERLPEFLYPY